ncbi:MAG: nucleotidyltransferase family protein [Janthinobacterium lividum]
MSGRHEFEQRREQIALICREHGVARLLVFGSILRDDFDVATSDVDLLVEFLPGVSKPWAGEYIELKDAMQLLFARPVDLVGEQWIKNPYRLRTIESEKELLYAA